MVLKRTDGEARESVDGCLSALSTDAAGELDVFRHDGDALGMNSAQVGVFEKTHQVRLARLLQRHDGGALEAQVGLEILRDFTHETLEGQLADEQLGALLVTTDLTKGDGAGAVTMGLLDAARGGGALTSGLGGELLARSLAARRLTRRLLRTSHSENSQQPSDTESQRVLTARDSHAAAVASFRVPKVARDAAPHRRPRVRASLATRRAIGRSFPSSRAALGSSRRSSSSSLPVRSVY